MLVVDDHALLAQTLQLALTARGIRAEVAPLDSVEAVTAAAVALPADLVLLDLDLGEPLVDGTTLVAPLLATGARVLVLTGSSSDRAARAIERGAVGSLRKDVALDRLVATVVAAARGEAVMGLQERRDVVAAARASRHQEEQALAPFDRLSQREAEVLRELADGTSVGRLAEAWCVSEATVRSHVRGVLTKLGVGSQLEAVAAARRSGWLDLSSSR
ncbi:response regulator transcription factor [Nocardioides litoris]|uniref:response regulator transcription factor n=1 Tax=Nocardioides litoris TaxID=1926648 RepID=UPI0014769F95|nr:response regulator transcription factor [Nocardioides litoris]